MQDWNGSELAIQRFFNVFFTIKVENGVTEAQWTLIQGTRPLCSFVLQSVDKLIATLAVSVPQQILRSNGLCKSQWKGNFPIQNQLTYVFAVFFDLVFFARFVFFVVCISFAFYASFWSNVWQALVFFFADVLFFATSFVFSFVRAFDWSGLQFVEKSRDYHLRGRMPCHETHTQKQCMTQKTHDYGLRWKRRLFRKSRSIISVWISVSVVHR